MINGAVRAPRQNDVTLPDAIEIVPLAGPVRAEIAVPGSKSITNRALVLAALAPGTTVLRGALWSEDTQVMTECLGRLGIGIELQIDPAETGNRQITVRGGNGAIAPGGSLHSPLDLFVGNAGTAARFLAALVCLGRGVYRIQGVPRMHERPQAALFQALRALGYRVDSPNDRLPALIHSNGPRHGRCLVSIQESSQFASALLLCAAAGSWIIEIQGENAEESPYVQMTSQLVARFAELDRQGVISEFQVEPDASSASYFWGAAHLLYPELCLKNSTAHSPIRVTGWDSMSPLQIDTRFPRFIPLPDVISRQTDLGDSIMTAIVLAPFADRPVRFTHLGRLRVQECERVRALRTELAKCGAQITETGDTLEVKPSSLHGADIATYNDHRMAMCFAILGLKVPGIRIQNPACVKKTFPNFFQKLAGAPPHGLGGAILNPKDGTVLHPAALQAE